MTKKLRNKSNQVSWKLAKTPKHHTLTSKFTRQFIDIYCRPHDWPVGPSAAFKISVTWQNYICHTVYIYFFLEICIGCIQQHWNLITNQHSEAQNIYWPQPVSSSFCLQSRADYCTKSTMLLIDETQVERTVIHLVFAGKELLVKFKINFIYTTCKRRDNIHWQSSTVTIFPTKSHTDFFLIIVCWNS